MLLDVTYNFEQVQDFTVAFSECLRSTSPPFSPTEITMILLELRHVTVKSDVSRRLLPVLTSLLSQCNVRGFTSREVALCMFGLSELSNEFDEVGDLVGVYKRILRKMVFKTAQSPNYACSFIVT